MNAENAHLYEPHLKALKEGKLQTSNFQGQWSDEREVSFTMEPDRYRRRPEPKFRAWKPEEVIQYIGALFRHKDSEWVSLITMIDNGALIHGTSCMLRLENVDSNYLCSLDHGKTWLPCGVQE